MKVLTIAETEATPVARFTKHLDEKQTELLQLIASIAVGESVEVTMDDWTGRKEGPGGLVYSRFHSKQTNSRKFAARRKVDGTGWIIKRIR